MLFRSAALAGADGATLKDVVEAMKDRFIGEPGIAADEAPALEALFGAPLATPAKDVQDLEARARRFCGVLLASPQFLLGGLPSGEPASVPKLAAP